MRWRRWIALFLVASIAVVAAVVLWNDHQRKLGEERVRALTSCHPEPCSVGFECARRCAREFLERNGYGDPALAKPDELIFDIVESMHGQTRKKVLAARVGFLQMEPIWGCEKDSGYELLFAHVGAPDNAPIAEGSLLTMDKTFSNIHLHHQTVLVRRGPAEEECRWLR